MRKSDFLRNKRKPVFVQRIIRTCRIPKIAAGCILLAVCAACLIPCRPCISLRDRKNPRQVRYIPCAADRGFVISYTHSVNHGRVHDFYTIRKNGDICIEKSRFVSYGAGMPEPDDYPGQYFVSGDGYIEIRGINRTVPQLLMAVGVVAAHELEADGRRYVLTDLFKPQTSLIIKYGRIPLLSILLKI